VSERAAGSAQNAACATPFAATVPGSVLLLALRAGLGTLFVLSGAIKVDLASLASLPSSTPSAFAMAINKFEMGLSESTVTFLAWAIPWTEIVAGLALLLGVMTRGAAMIVAGLMVAFSVGIASVIMRDISTTCSCFGSIRMICPTEVGTCHIVRNAGFAVTAAVIWALGPGRLSLEWLLHRRA
jgi:uncharacterized membrane protein YphA (DoxX/SURF4 family)